MLIPDFVHDSFVDNFKETIIIHEDYLQTTHSEFFQNIIKKLQITYALMLKKTKLYEILNNKKAVLYVVINSSCF